MQVTPGRIHLMESMLELYQQQIGLELRQKALHFDGSNDLLNFGMSSAWIFGTNSFSVLFWFKTDSIATRKVGLVTLQNGGGDIKFSIGYGGAWATPEADGDKLGLGINYSPGIWGVDVTGVTSLADSEWHHVALTRYENEWTLYLDGHPEQGVSVSYPYSSGSGTLLVGAHVVGDRYFQGDIDDVRIYSRALSQETISTLADQPIVHIQTAVEIKWLSTSNIVYQVQWADSLQTNVWNDLGNPIIGDGSIKNIFDSTHLIQKRYYRVLLP